MRLVPFVVLVSLACGSADDVQPTSGVLETTATSYVATPMSSGSFSYGIPVVLRLRNNGEDLIRVSRCLATTNHPPYWVEKATDGDAAWQPNLTCVLQGPTLYDLRPGEERTDTLQLRAPWQRSFNGQPIGAVEGEFYIVYETRICRTVSTNGLTCLPLNQMEYVRSNKFRITTP